MARSTIAFDPQNPRPRMLVQRDEYIAQCTRHRLANLWQMPVLLVSLGLFTLSAYLFVDPQPAPAFEQQSALATVDVRGERFDAAIGRLNDLLATRPEPAEEAQARLLLAEALDMQLRRNRRVDTPGTHRRIIHEIQMAYTLGQVPTVQASDRLARSFEALGDVDEAAANYQRAVELLEQGGKPDRALPMRRSAIDMLIAFDRKVTATEAINRFLVVPGLADDERAWALCEMARIHVDEGRHAEARSLLSAAAALAPDEAIQGQVSFRLGYAAWKLGERGDSRKHLLLARQQFGEGHPQGAEACYLLGRVAQDEENFAEAIAWFDLVLSEQPYGRTAARAAVARGTVLVLSDDDQSGVAELARLAEELSRNPALRPVQADLLAAVQRCGRILGSRHHYSLALDLLQVEQALDPQGAPDLVGRRSRYMEGLIEQAEAALALAGDASAGAGSLQLRDARRQGAEAHLEYALHLAGAGDSGYPRLLWKAVEQFVQAGSPPAGANAIERFISQQPEATAVPEALLRLARLHVASGETAKAMQVLSRLREEHAQCPAARDGGLLLAELLHRAQRFDEALELLEEAVERAEPTAEDSKAHLVFLRGDCHRQLAVAAVEAVQGGQAKEQATPSEPELAASVTDPRVRHRLETAERLFGEAINLYAQTPPQSDGDRNCERLAVFGRAHCVFDLGRYEEAITLYQHAAARYRDDLSVLTASLQIASANAALGRADDLRDVGPGLRRLLERITAEGSAGEGSSLPRSYWHRWLKHVKASGLW